MNDPQLAYVICRLYEDDSTCASSQSRKLLSDCCDADDMFIRSIAFWSLGHYMRAKNTLLHSVSDPLSAEDVIHAANLYSFLRSHPMITHNSTQVDKDVLLFERRLYFFTAYTHLQRGCPQLALEALLLLPEALCANNLIQSNDCNGCDTCSKMAQIDQTETERFRLNAEQKADTFADQVKHMICFKLMVDELSTLTTGLEADGGHLRNVLYSWLEKEIHLLNKLCNPDMATSNDAECGNEGFCYQQ
jgi:hypothetical protein